MSHELPKDSITAKSYIVRALIEGGFSHGYECRHSRLSSLRKAVRLFRREGFSTGAQKLVASRSVVYVWENCVHAGLEQRRFPQEVDVRCFVVPLNLANFESTYRGMVDEQQDLPVPSLDTSVLPLLQAHTPWNDIVGCTLLFEAVVEEDIVHRTWVGIGRDGSGLYQHMYPASRDSGYNAYSGLSWTCPSMRGKGLLRRMYANIYSTLAGCGCTTCVLAIAREATAAHRVQESLGSRLLWEGHVLRVLGCLKIMQRRELHRGLRAPEYAGL